MSKPTFKPIASSVTSPRDNKTRKEVLIDAPACWNEDYETEIHAKASKYYRKYMVDGSEQDQHRNIRYKIYVPLMSSNKVIVEVRFRTEGGAKTITSDPLPMNRANEMQAVVVRGLDFWNKRYTVKISDPQRREQRCRTRVMEIEYRVVWVDTPEVDTFNDLTKAAAPGAYHSKLIVYENIAREHVSNGMMEIALTTNPYIAAHEYAHVVGLPDEYPDGEGGKCVRYVRPDAVLDTPIDLLEFKSIESPLAGIMSTAYSFAAVPRHAWNIAIEIQELLSQKLGRTITCEIIQLR